MFWTKHYSKEEEAIYKFIKNILGYRPRNLGVYKLAFVHRSKSVEDQQHYRNNERLEYLGDAVLGAIVAEYLYKRFPNEDEGFLTETRSKIVSRASLGKLGQHIGLHELIHYNRSSQGIFKSMEGDAFEALVGAIYLEKGYRFTRKVIINRILALYVDLDELMKKETNFKGHLIDWAQKRRRRLLFRSDLVHGSDRRGRRQYKCHVLIDGKEIESAIDYSIKNAEQRASEKALQRIEEIEEQLKAKHIQIDDNTSVAPREAAAEDSNTVGNPSDKVICPTDERLSDDSGTANVTPSPDAEGQVMSDKLSESEQEVELLDLEDMTEVLEDVVKVEDERNVAYEGAESASHDTSEEEETMSQTTAENLLAHPRKKRLRKGR